LAVPDYLRGHLQDQLTLSAVRFLQAVESSTECSGVDFGDRGPIALALAISNDGLPVRKACYFRGTFSFARDDFFYTVISMLLLLHRRGLYYLGS